MDEGLRNFKLVFTEHYPWVVRKISRIVKDRSIAEDLAQEVFLKLYEKPPEDFSKLKAWLHRVSTHTTYDYFRKQKIETDKLVFEEGVGVASGSHSLDAVLAEKEWIQSTLEQLPPRDRRAILLQQEGYSYNEIAHLLGVNQKIVGSILMRARDRFKKMTASEED